MTVEIPIKVVSELNAREHWRVRQQRARKQRHQVALHLRLRGVRPGIPLHVVMTRFGRRRLDSDNLAGAFKHVRDEIADWLGINDGDETKATWECRQLMGGKPAIRIDLLPRGGTT